MAQNVEPVATASATPEIDRPGPVGPRGLRGRPQVAQPVAARVAQVPQAPPGADRAGDDRVPDRRRRPRPRAAAVQLHRHPQARPDRRRRRAAAVTCQHPMGETGGLQRDVLTLVVNGSRTSLLIGFSSMAIGVIIGTFVGAIAGFAGSIIDNLLMRLVDVMLSLPILFVILVAAEVPGQRDGLDGHRDLRAVLVDGREPARAQPVPVDPRTRVRRGGASRSASATGGSSSGTSCPTPSARSSSSASLLVAGQHHRGGVRELPRVRRRPDRRPRGATSCRAACSSSPRATGGGRCSRVSRSSSRCWP